MAEKPQSLSEQLNAMMPAQAQRRVPVEPPLPITTEQVPGAAISQSISSFGFGPGNPLRLPTAKERKVAETARAKQLTMGDRSEQIRAAAAEYNGNQMAEDPVLRDLRDLSFGELVQKYGSDVANNRDRLLDADSEFLATLREGRTPGQQVGDAALGVAAGGVNLVGSIAQATAGLVSAEGADLARRGKNYLSEGIRSFQSDELTERRESRNIINQLNAEDSQRQYESESSVTADGSMIAGLKKFGRDIVSTTKNVFDDPAYAADIVAEGVGSLGPSVGAAKLATKVLGKTIARGAAVPLAVGSVEGTASYDQAFSHVMGMTEEDLSLGSRAYGQLRESGATHEDAQLQIANSAGQKALALALPAAAVAGKFVEKFELNPTRVGSMSSALAEIGKQTLEEGFQEGVSTLASDQAIADTADAGRPVGQDLGQSVALGAVGGLGVSGALQAPGLAARGAAVAANAAVDGAQKVVDGRLQSVAAGLDDASPVGMKKTRESMDTARQGLAEVVASEPPLAAEAAPATPEDTGTVTPDRPLIERAREVMVMTGPELNEVPDAVRKMVTDEGEVAPDDLTVDRLDVLLAVLEEIDSGKQSPEDATAAALWVHDQVQNIEALVQEDLSELPIAIQNAAQSTQEAMSQILSNPVLVKALEGAQEATLDLASLPEVTDENVNSPEIQEAYRKTVLLAQSNPAGIDPKFVNAILDQSARGKFKIAPKVLQRLKAAATIAQSVVDADFSKKALEEKTEQEVRSQPGGEKASFRKTADIVRQDILGRGNKLAKGQLGLSSHLSKVVSAMGSGDLTTAQTQMESLRNFGQHFLNKLEAGAASAALKRGSNNRVPFRTWDGSKWIEANQPNAQGMYVNPFSPNGVQQAEEVAIDAKTVIDIYNSLLAVYGGQLTGDPLPAPKRVPIEEILGRPAPTSQKPVAEVPKPVEAKPAKKKPEPVIKKEQPDVPDAKVADRAEKTPSEAPAERANSDSVDGAPESPKSRETGPEKSPDAGAGGSPVADLKEVPEAPEAEVVAEVAEEPAPANAFERFRKSAKGVVRFLRAYKVDPEASRLMQQERPLEFVVDLLSGKEKLEGATLNYEMSGEQVAGLLDLVRTEGTVLVNGMNQRLQTPHSAVRGGKMTPIEVLRNEGIDPTGWREARNLNIVDPVTGEYDPQLIQAASLAALHWVMNMGSRPPMDAEEVAKLWGINEADVSAELLNIANSGMNGNIAAESLAQMIMAFWGASVNRDVTMSDTLGIAQGVAAELLAVMTQNLTTEAEYDVVVPRNGSEETVRVISVQLGNGKTSDKIQALGFARKFLEDAFIPEVDTRGYTFGSPAQEGPKTQKRNRRAKLGKNMLEALKQHRNTKYFRNTPYVDLMRAMGEDLYKEVLGFQAIDEANMNAQDIESLKGKNASLNRAWNGVLAHDEELRSYALQGNLDANEVPTHFNWFVGSNERIMAEGFNPQADKSMREAFVATRAELDLTDEAQQNLFWITVAQSLGVKTEKLPRVEAVAEAQETILENFSGSVLALKEWLQKDQGAELSTESRAILKAELEASGEPTAKMMHALLAVARKELAEEAGGTAATKFQHDLALEADGKTDGPINALVHFLSGAFTWDQIYKLRKGGLFLGETDTTLNQHYAADPSDLYQETASNMTEVISSKLAEVEGTPAAPHMQAVLRLMDRLGELEFDEKTGDLTIGRNALKNPLTITIYGSGLNGIAGKVAGFVMDTMYAQMTELAQRRKAENNPNLQLADLELFREYPELLLDLNTLFTSHAFYGKKKQKWFSFKTIQHPATQENVAAPLGNLGDPVKFRFSPRNRQMLMANMKEFFVKPMGEAIEKNVGGAMGTLRLVQRATQLQGVVLQDVFQRTVQEVLKEKRESSELEKGEYLSQSDYETIFDRLAKFGARIAPAGSNENFLELSTKEKARSEVELFRNMDSKYSGNATLAMPSDPGVSAAPMLTISRGDALMMVNFFANQELGAVPEDVTRTLPVFDGLEIAADIIESMSTRINGAVLQGWLTNPMADVEVSIDDFLRQGAQGPEGEVQSPEAKAAVAELRELLPTIRGTARSIQARKNVLKRIQISVDHMASGEAPFTQEGDPIKGDLLEGLNTMFEEELGVLHRKFEADTEAGQVLIEKPSDEFKAAVKAYGVEIPGKGVTRMTARSAVRMVRDDANLAGISEDQRKVFQAITKFLPKFQFYFGDVASLTVLRNEMHPEMVESGPVQSGQIDFLNGKIYISNQAGETLLHETLHAAVTRQLLDFYDNPGMLSTLEQDAIRNLETLMGQFLEMNFSEDLKSIENADGDMVTAAVLLREEIEHYLEGNTTFGKAAAVSEFIAWTLSNQNLVEALKKSRVQSPLKRLIGDVLKGIRRMLGLNPTQSLDMFSNILWNTSALVQSSAATGFNTSSAPARLLLNQVHGRRSDARLGRIMQSFEAKVAAHLRARPIRQRIVEEAKIWTLADDAVNLFTSNGFDLDPEQTSAFRAMQAAMASTMEIDNKSLVLAQKIFTTVTKGLKVEDLMVGEPGPNEDPNDRSQANAKFNVLTGKFGTLTDGENRSNLLASFMAISQVDPDFRKVLENTRMPKGAELDFSSADAALTSTANRMLDILGATIAGEPLKGNSTIGSSLDRLTEVMARIETDDRTLVEKKTHSIMGQADTAVKGFLDDLGDRVTAFSDRQTGAGPIQGLSNTQKMLRSGSVVLAGILNEKRGKSLVAALQSFGNTSKRVPTAVLELMNEIIGMNGDNDTILAMVNKGKYAISGVRQDHRETLPKILAEQFSRKLSKIEWGQLYTLLGKTDLVSLGSTLSSQAIRRILTDASFRKAQILETEEALRGLAPQQATKYLEKAEQLAEYMMTGKIDPNNHNLLRNAKAIANLFGETGQPASTPSDQVIQLIDQLTTLYAVNKVPDATVNAVSTLAQNEAAGVDFLVFYLHDLNRAEKAKSWGAATVNGYKGYIPAEVREGAKLMVADDSEFAKLSSLGYTRIGDYRGSGQERGSKGYYFSTVGGNNTYLQGALQTVHTSAYGVDPRTGRTVGSGTAGVIKGPAAQAIHSRLRARQGAPRTRGEALMPVYDEMGVLVAYERSMSPDMRARMQPSDHLGEMIGAWSGRQAEEELAQGFNRILVDEIKRIHEKGVSDGRGREFVNLAEPGIDRIYKDAWRMIPPEVREYAESQFGEKNLFPVRRDMINNAVGYREFTVGDAWIGNTRLDEKSMKLLRDTMTVVLGKNAFKYAVTAEKAWQAGISVAKNTIVIRSVIVPVSNMASNFIQLMTLGVSVRDIAKGTPEKLVEIDQHLKNLQRSVEIKALMARHRGDRIMTRKLQTEQKSLEDSSRRMSIWPLIEAGEFATIAEGLTDADAAISQGKWADYVQNVIEKVPTRLGTVGRYAVITRDTALFQGMSRAVQYGDFIAKAVLYDHMTKRQGLKKDVTLKFILEEFVAYNLLPGRVRSYSESMGLTWFWAYKLRSIKVAARHIRNNPVRALLATVGSGYLPDVPSVSVGSPITDNMLSVMGDGRFGYSVGPGMLFNAPNLNPWVNLAR